jgi:transcriptional regulator with XRE-family HTH domain
MIERKPLANTLLAEWLNDVMADYVDPGTRRRSISQSQLSALGNIPQAVVSEILIKGHIPKPDILNRLASFFDVDPITLYQLAYLPEDTEDEAELAELLGRIRAALRKMPPGMRKQVLADIVTRVEMEDIALSRFEETEKVNELS